MQSILKLKEVTKTYKKLIAVNHINLNIKQGGIYGLIGKNGAGKTTLMRIIAGLTYMNSGDMWLFGENQKALWDACRKRMSFIVETPYMSSTLTAAQNMNLQRIQRGIDLKDCIDEKLELVGLGDVKNKKVGEFSLGMKQRLGIAMAMLPNPEFLILDEPINGLDPIAIIEMRELILRLNRDYKTTILISSHILEELYQIATDYIIMDHGSIIKTLSLNELEKACSQAFIIGVDKKEKAIQIIEGLGYKQIVMEKENSIKILEPVIEPTLLAKSLVLQDVGIYYMTPMKKSLEQYFVELIGSEKEND